VHRKTNRNSNRTLKYFLIFFGVFLSLPIYGQMYKEIDTVRINEVVIKRTAPISGLAGYKESTVDSSVLTNSSNSNLSDMLSENTNIFIKSYGMGGTSTPAFRGTLAGHTLIDWNGININSPMLGQADLSIIPAGLIDDIHIYFGGASMSLNNGGIGGTVNLETKPVWKKETLISLNFGEGSFGRYTGLVRVRTGNEKFQTVTKGYFQNADNNFRYLNTESGPEPVWQTRTNSQVRQRGFIQEFYVRNSNSNASARIWYQSADRNLPSSLLIPSNTGERQFDESLRTMLNLDVFRGKTDFSFTGAWLLNTLNYFNRLASIDSRNQSQTLTLKGSIERPVGEYSKLKIVLDEQACLVKSNNYDRNKTRNTATISTLIDIRRERFGSTILLREILDKNTFLIPDFSLGAQFRLLTDREYYLKASVSRNSKIPSMNDMYWVPGGNPGLKNEYAIIFETSYEMNQKISDPLSLKYVLTVFRYNIKDMIQWHQGEFSYWTPDNIQNVNSTGGETSLSLDFVQNKLNANLRASYSFTKSVSGGSDIENDNTRGKQLMYIPENQAKAFFRIGYKNVYSSWSSNFTGKRYIYADNSKYLPGYFVNNVSTGIKFNIKATSINLAFNIDNLFNINYQTIAYYPLPGRSFFLKILFQLIK
jgi:outer membrane cobalamin receptor